MTRYSRDGSARLESDRTSLDLRTFRDLHRMLLYTAPRFGGPKRNRHGGTTETGKHRARGVPSQRTEENREVLWGPVRMEIPRGPGPGLVTIPSGARAW